MPRTSFPFARHPIEGVPHGTSIAIGPNPFSGSKGRRNNNFPPDPAGTPLYQWKGDDLATLWQDSSGTSQVTADGQTVARWDAQGVSNHAAQSIAAWCPIYKENILNSKGGVKFDGTNDQLDIFTQITAANANESTAFVVVSGWTTGAYQGLLGGNGLTPDNYYLRITDTDKAEVLEGFVGNSMTSTGSLATTGAIIVAQFSDTGNAYGLWSGLTDIGSGASTVTFTTNTGRLGAQENVSPQESFSGYIHEIIFYNSVLSAANRQSTTNYLRGRWGSSL
jgi:hypothetical protein